MYCHSGTSLVHKLAEVHRLVHSHQPISIVLMVNLAASARSPATADVAAGVEWMWGWFWVDAEAVGHDFGG